MPIVRVFAAAAAVAMPLIVHAAEPVGPWSWSRALHDPADPQPQTIAADGTIETAQLLSGDAAGGVIRASQWSGANQISTRSFAANAFVAPAGANWFVGLAGFSIRRGRDLTGSWTYQRMLYQDAHLRFAFVDAAPADLVAAHGAGFGLRGVFPWNAIVVNLSFRHETATADRWQGGDYNGVPLQVGVWQVRAGQTLQQAQGDDANRLSALEVLTGETTPALASLAKLQVQPGGQWQLLLDLGGDGVVDVDLVAGVNAPAYTIPDIDESSGLVVTADTAGGARTGEVCRTAIDVRYVAGPSSTPPATPRNRRPLLVRAPTTSATSPAHIEATRWSPANDVALTGPGGEVPLIAMERLTWGNLALDAGGAATAWTMRQPGVGADTVVVGSTTWVATELSGSRSLAVRSGDSVRFRMPVSGRVRVEEDGVVVVPPTDVAAAAERIQLFDRGGIVHVIAEDAGGAQIADVEIVVCDVDLSRPIPVKLGYELGVDVGIEPVTRPDLFVFTANEPAKLAVREIGVGEHWERVGVKPTANGKLALLARLGGPEGPIIGWNEVQEFRIVALDRDAFLIDPVTRSGRSRIRMEPYVPNQLLKFEMSGSRSSFAGGARAFTVNTSDAQTSLGEPGFAQEFPDRQVPPEPSIPPDTVEPPTGEPVGVFDYEIHIPAGENAHCHGIFFFKGDGYYLGVPPPTATN